MREEGGDMHTSDTERNEVQWPERLSPTPNHMPEVTWRGIGEMQDDLQAARARGDNGARESWLRCDWLQSFYRRHYLGLSKLPRSLIQGGSRYNFNGSAEMKPKINIQVQSKEELMAGAKKFDEGKPPIFDGFLRYFPHAIEAVAMVSEYGYRKYGAWGGWRKVPDAIARYTNAKARHSNLETMGDDYDSGDSGLAHAAQEAWNAMARLELLIVTREIQIRRGNDIKEGKPVLGTARSI